MAFWCRFFIRDLMLVLRIFNLVRLSIECSYMAPLTLVVMVMRGLVFRPLFYMVLISGLYLVCLCMRTCSGNMSWLYVNSMSWSVRVGEGVISVCVWFGASIMHRMYGVSLA
jgi:hypothetical protein